MSVPRPGLASSRDPGALVVFSHRRWDSAYQRPQQVLSRLARERRVLFIEEPRFCAGDPRAELRAPVNGVTVLTPHTPLNAPGFHDDQIPVLSKLIASALARERFADYGAWLYTPMALPLLQKLTPRCVVYDCVDELAAFAGAPRQLVQRENALLRVANAVFCSGPSLYESRRTRHEAVYLLPDSVDRAQFAGAGRGSPPPEVKALARPRLGYAGIIDERLDLDLLAKVAAARPEWEICLVGPVEGIDPALLPHAPNVHYFGARAYGEWPSFLGGWDVGIIPFAQTDATRFANPAATLECMAAGLPIVATPIRDVERLYGNAVRFAKAPLAFIAACDAALVAPAADRAQQVAAMRALVASTSWDVTTREVARILESVARDGPTEAARRMLEPARSHAAPARAIVSRASCVILGAGATGLSAAYHHGAGSVLLEREPKVGGGCRSIEDTGFVFDHAGHIMVSDDPDVQDLYRLLLGDNVHWQESEAWTWRNGEYARAPLRPAISGGAASTSAAPQSGVRFGYPLRGGFQALMDGFLPLLRGELVLGTDVQRVSPLLRIVEAVDGRRFRYETLISTLPLPVLVAAMGEEAPAEIRRLASALRHTSVRCVNLGVARPHVTDKHWIEFTGNVVFQRVFAQGNASPHCNAPGGFALTCEIGYSSSHPLPATGAALRDRCVRDCVRVGLLDPSDALLTSNQVDIAYARVVDDAVRAEHVARIRDWLATFDILLAGRYGEWQDCGSDAAFIAGRNAALTAQGAAVAARRA